MFTKTSDTATHLHNDELKKYTFHSYRRSADTAVADARAIHLTKCKTFWLGKCQNDHGIYNIHQQSSHYQGRPEAPGYWDKGQPWTCECCWEKPARRVQSLPMRLWDDLTQLERSWAKQPTGIIRCNKFSQNLIKHI